jgi:hypothetical protein
MRGKFVAFVIASVLISGTFTLPAPFAFAEDPIPFSGKFVGKHDDGAWETIGKYNVGGEKFKKIPAAGTFEETDVDGCEVITAQGTISLPGGDINADFDLQKCGKFPKYSGTFEVTGGTGQYADMTGSGEASILAGKKHFAGQLDGQIVSAPPDFLDLAVTNNGGGNVAILLGDGAGGFGPATTYTTGPNPHSVTAGDLNGDSNLDLAVANFGSSIGLAILLGDGEGGFGPGTNFAVGGIHPISVALGDFDGDANLDVVTANYDSDNISVYLGDGSGNVGAATTFAVGSHPYSVAIGDFDGDTNLDLAVSNQGTNDVSILLGDGAGGFGSAANYAVVAGPRSVVLGDFNDDSIIDLAVANSAHASVSILLGNGDGTFGAQSPFGVGLNPASVVAGDFDGDSNLDLVTANFPTNSISIILGDGAGGFGPRTDFASGGTLPLAVAAGDFDGDSNQDVAVANANTNNVAILLGDGTGGFGAPALYATGPSPHSIAIGNFD